MKPIYLEPSEEITSVIDKLSNISDRSVAIVVPKNSSLFQSLINLKLLAKEAKKQDKNISIISADKVGQRLAGQVGLKAYATLGALGPMRDEPMLKTAEPQTAEELEEIEGVRVNRYRPVAGSAEAIKEAETAALTEEETANLPAMMLEEPDDLVVPEKKNEEIIAKEEPTQLSEKPADKKETEGAQRTVSVEPESTVSSRHSHLVSANEPDSNSTELPPVISRGYIGKERAQFVIPWRSLIAALVILVIAAGLVYLFLPHATASITFPATPVDQTLTLVAQTAGDGTDLTIGGNTLVAQKTVSKTFAATGKKDIGNKAAGSVTIFNKASSSPVTLTAGTIFTASSQSFTLDKAVTVPGASVSNGSVVPGQATGSITAAAAGEASNLSNATFAIAGQSAQVNATGSTTGGLSKQVTVLSQADIDGAVNDLKTQANDQAIADLQSKLNGQTLLDKSTWQAPPKQTITNAVGDQVDNATATYTVEYDAIVFDANTALTRIKATLSKNLTDKQSLVVQNPGTDIVYTFKSLAPDKSSIAFSAAAKAFITSGVDQQAIAAAIKDKSTAKARSIIIDTYGATDATVTLSPSWWPARLPLLSREIKIEYSFAQTK